MQLDESPTCFVRRVFREVVCDLSAESFERVPELFHPDFVQRVDSKELNRESFVNWLRVQKSRLDSKPEITWKKLVATAPIEGRVHVTSVHAVSVKLRNGETMLQQVMAMLEIDLASGMLIECDELTRTEPVPQPQTSRNAPQPQTHSQTARAAVDLFHAAVLGSTATKLTMDRPVHEMPNAKQAKLEPSRISHARPASTPPDRMPGVALKRTGVSDLLASSCNFSANVPPLVEVSESDTD